MTIEAIKKSTVYNKLSLIISNKLFQVLMFTVMTAVASKIAIPIKPVPFTLQTLVVLLSGAWLGKKGGFYSQITYLFLGAAGIPVFAFIPDGTFGIASLFGPTGGYLLAFPLAAYLTGAILERSKSYFAIISAFVLGEVLINLSGVLYLNAIYVQNINVAFTVGSLVFLFWTVIKVFIGTTIVTKFRK
ncbi:MAG: biotin transporter BioY [Ignavibacteriales bacterium]|jgi:biotin transport system substrate-specific component|nr:biotin transporter BioY [Ignavibacteriaceae bacterium]NLH60526.1 biotin transporter BioY [Ignavibacteriales bacterium]